MSKVVPTGRRGWRALAAAAAGLLYPRTCFACGRLLEGGAGADLCAGCALLLRPIGKNRCPKCGFGYGPYVEGAGACPSCRPGAAFAQAVGVFRYEGAAREAIHRWKYQGDLHAGAALRDHLLDQLEQETFVRDVEVAAPVPLHWLRRLHRRFNQSEFLARAAANRFGWRVETRALRRIRNTRSQVGLNPPQREENVRGAFRVVRPEAVRGKVVLLLDDVLTTCATVRECSRALKMAGAERVYVAVVAR